jgi:hypothetical protein
VVGLGPELYPFFWTEPRDSTGLRRLLAFQDQRGECAVAAGWDVCLPTRPEHPEGVVRLEVRLEQDGEVAVAAFTLDVRPDPRTGRLRFLRTLPFVLRLRRLALYPQQPTDFLREEGITLSLDPGHADAVREVLDAYNRLGLP